MTDQPARRMGRRWPVVVLAIPLLVLEWLVISAAVSALLLWSAQRGVGHAREDARHGDVGAALADGHAVQRRTAMARHLLSGPPWSALSGVPGVSAAQDLVRAVDGISHHALPPLVDAAARLKGPQLRRPDGGIRLASLQQARVDVQAAQEQLGALTARVRSIDAGPLGFARSRLLSAVASLRRDLAAADLATRLGPTMLGSDGPRYYVLVSQNTAELRGTGGLIGSYAEIVADHGALTIVRSGPDYDLHSAPDPIAVSADFDAAWGPEANEDWKDVNESPDLPSVATVIAALWHDQFGEKIDGVVTIDAQVAGDLAAAGGPIRLSNGKRLQPSQFARYLQQDIYRDYPTDADQAARKEVVLDLQQQLFDRVRHADAGPILGALVKAEATGDLKLWSSHPEEEALLSRTLLGGRLPERPGPFAGVVINNAAGNKTDAFLDTSVSWKAPACSSARRTTTLTVTVRNTITRSYLVPYLAGSTGVFKAGVPKGRNRSYLSLYGSVGATDPVMTIDGRRTTPAVFRERGHPFASTFLTTDPGQRHTVVVTWEEPAIGAVQPLLVPALTIAPAVQVDVPRCG